MRDTFSMSVEQGYNFKKDGQEPMGFITALKIATTTITADQELVEPEAQAKLKAVAVMDSLTWGEPTTPMQFSGRVSITNMQQLKGMIEKDMTNVNVEVTYICWDYDPAQSQGKYYPKLHSNKTALKGVIEKMGGELAINISDIAAPSPQSPLNYQFYFSIAPDPVAQEIHRASSVTNKWVKPWGRTVA